MRPLQTQHAARKKEIKVVRQLVMHIESATQRSCIVQAGLMKLTRNVLKFTDSQLSIDKAAFKRGAPREPGARSLP
jgi:hypothetical protein